MALKPWYKVVTPREDLREGKPLDASEFAVHLEHVKSGTASADYTDPILFFERTFLTKNLTSLAAEVIRRLSGETTETSAVFNMSTQFGGGKTHALTLLYHLSNSGKKAKDYAGVNKLLSIANISSVPEASSAIFVGTEFDSIRGRGGNDGTPLRKTPWGEIAFQIGGEETFNIVKEHDESATSPAGDVIRQILKNNKPCLILMDEVMNYISRNRKSGLTTQFYDFIHNLSEAARGEKNVVLVASIPASELEMSADDQSDFDRFKKLLDRVGKPVVISADSETSEIIRRRLFEWDTTILTQEGKILLPKEANDVCKEYHDYLLHHRQQLPNLFPIDKAKDVFLSTYPFHPLVLSVFERKWQSLPRFQQTRGVLRLLAQWVSNAYQAGFKGAHKDKLIGLGTAPLDDSLFRTAVIEQLGEARLEGPITSDIIGKEDSFSIRMDEEAVEHIKKARLHRKVATTIFFESSGGQQNKEATMPEIRLAVADPDFDIGNIETVLDELSSNCYYLSVEKNRFKFSLAPNLNKLLSDRRANIQKEQIDELVKSQIQDIFSVQSGVELVYFPKESKHVPDRGVITIVIISPEKSLSDKETLPFIEQITKEYGTSGRTYKSALIFTIADSSASLSEEARKLLAWEDIEENDSERLDDKQKRLLSENIKKANRDLGESVWRTYKNIAILNRDNSIRIIDLGLIHSSAAYSMAALILTRLNEEEEAVPNVSPNFLIRNWPPAYTEWSTRSVRNAFFASPRFPRLTIPESLKETIASGVEMGQLAYIGKSESGRYDPFYFETDLDAEDIEFSDDMYIVKEDEARKHIEPPSLTYLEITPKHGEIQIGKSLAFLLKGLDQHGQDFPVDGSEWSATGGEINSEGVFHARDNEGVFAITAHAGDISATVRIVIHSEQEPHPPPDGIDNKHGTFSWSGVVPYQKWMNFYIKVIEKFVSQSGLRIHVRIDVDSEEGLSEQKIDETKQALKDLGLDGDTTNN